MADATQALLDEREKTHGLWEDNARISQGLLRVLRTGRCWPRLADTQLEALQMISHKEHRIVNGDPDHADHWDDIAGYATLEARRLRACAQRGQPNTTILADWLLSTVLEVGFTPTDGDLDSFVCTAAQLRDLVREVRLDHGALRAPPAELAQVKHPSHSTRPSDASTYDEVCTRCGATDITGGGWGALALPCTGMPKREKSKESAWTGPVAEFTTTPPAYPCVERAVIIDGAVVTFFLADRRRLDPELVEEQLPRLAGKLPPMDLRALHPVVRSLYESTTRDDMEYHLRPEFAGWAS